MEAKCSLGKIVSLRHVHRSLSRWGYKERNKNLPFRRSNLNIIVRHPKNIAIPKFLLEKNFAIFLVEVKEKMTTRKITRCSPQNFTYKYQYLHLSSGIDLHDKKLTM